MVIDVVDSYAPDISGVAHSTAKVTVTQMGRVLYETQVPAGPFRIQDIGDSVSGTLHVRIEEQNGQIQEYDVSTASMPFLTREGTSSGYYLCFSRNRVTGVIHLPLCCGAKCFGNTNLRKRRLYSYK